MKINLNIKGELSIQSLQYTIIDNKISWNQKVSPSKAILVVPSGETG